MNFGHEGTIYPKKTARTYLGLVYEETTNEIDLSWPHYDKKKNLNWLYGPKQNLTMDLFDPFL